MPLEQVQACFCAQCELCSQLMVACVYTRISKQLVDHSTQPVHKTQAILSKPKPQGEQRPTRLRCAVML